MREERITIRLNETLLQRMERVRRALPAIIGEKRRDGALALSTLVRLAVEDYVARAEGANLFSAQGFLLMAHQGDETDLLRSFASLDEAKDSIPGKPGPHAWGTPEAARARYGPHYSILDVGTMKHVWEAFWQTDMSGAPVVERLVERAPVDVRTGA